VADLEHQPDVGVARLQLLFQRLGGHRRLLPVGRRASKELGPCSGRRPDPDRIGRVSFPGAFAPLQTTAELTAGGVDFPALGLAHADADAARTDDLDKALDRRGTWPL